MSRDTFQVGVATTILGQGLEDSTSYAPNPNLDDLWWTSSRWKVRESKGWEAFGQV